MNIPGCPLKHQLIFGRYLPNIHLSVHSKLYKVNALEAPIYFHNHSSLIDLIKNTELPKHI